MTYQPATVRVKSSADKDPKNALFWGEYWQALALEAWFVEQGYEISEDPDVLLFMYGGLTLPTPGSHRVLVTVSGTYAIRVPWIAEYDLVYAASEKVYDKLVLRRPNVHRIYGVTPHATRPWQEKKRYEVIFVGNCHWWQTAPKDRLPLLSNPLRPDDYAQVERWSLETVFAGGPLDFSLRTWGRRKEWMPPQYHVAQRFPYERVGELYADAAIVLNDHFVRLSREGILGNRVFDTFLAGGFLISDPHPGLDEMFGEGVVPQYTSPEQLRELIHYYLPRPEERRRIVEHCQERCRQVQMETVWPRILADLEAIGAR